VDVLLEDELTRQADVLVSLGYPETIPAEATRLIDPLRARIGNEARSEASGASFVLVPGSALLPV
jgi:hypothetical protein